MNTTPQIDFDLKLSDNLDSMKAGYTHYLNNSKNGVSAKYKETAKSFIQEYHGLFHEQSLDKTLIQYLDNHVKSTQFPFKYSDKPSFKFIDLFAGVGGFRLALQSLNGKSVFSSEWDVNSQKTYYANYGEFPFGDITKKEIKNSIPDDFDILCAGFPCQAFSIAGERKGFQDTRGTLFFDLEEIISEKRPKAIFLENVKNLQSHDNGKTFTTMLDILENKLGYKMFFKVLNSSKHANIPQNRERIFMVGFDPNQVNDYQNFKFPQEIKLTKTIHDILDSNKQDDYFYYNNNQKYYPILKESMLSIDTVYQWRRVYVRENKSKMCPTLTANMGTGGHNVPLIKDNYGIRKLTPKECFLFQGYPEEFALPNVARSKLYMQAGNSVTVPLIKRIAEKILDVL